MKLIYFGAKWCPSCKTLLPMVKQELLRYGVSDTMKDRFEYIDVDEQPERASFVTGLPLVVIQDDDENIIDTRNGMLGKSDIKKVCEYFKVQ